MYRRYLYSNIYEHLNSLRQMVFLVGPRQVGKTTLAKSFIPHMNEGVNYFNWDDPEHKKILLNQLFRGKYSLAGANKEIMVFDEIHKYPRWKNTIKGLFDRYEPKTHWIITGSALLNVRRRGQDSLLGRCFTYNLAPLSLAEISPDKDSSAKILDELGNASFEDVKEDEWQLFKHLDEFSGFPEPFLNGTRVFLEKWRTSRLDRLINQDLAGTENLRNLPLVESLMYLLPERVGSPLSINSLREDLDVHHATLKHWLILLERTFYGFTIKPFSRKLIRGLKKEGKWYLWDWTEITDAGVRFENLIAIHLMKYINYVNDTGSDKLSLHYVRDKEKREVDFLIARKTTPIMLIECKFSDETPHNPIFYFAEKLGVKIAFQLIFNNIKPRQIVSKNGITLNIISAPSFLMRLV